MPTSLITAAIAAQFLVLITASVYSKPVPYKILNGKLVIEGIGPKSPIIYDNDWFGDVADDDYLFGLNTLGEVDLRGVIVSRDMWDIEKGGHYKLEDQIKDYQEHGMDSWSMYLLSKKVRYIQVPHIGETKRYIKNWERYDRTKEFPDNEACKFIKAIEGDNKWRTTPADGVGILFAQTNKVATKADHIFIDSPPIRGHKVASDNYDVLKLDNYIDYKAAADEFYKVMLNPKAWGKANDKESSLGFSFNTYFSAGEGPKF